MLKRIYASLYWHKYEKKTYNEELDELFKGRTIIRKISIGQET